MAGADVDAPSDRTSLGQADAADADNELQPLKVARSGLCVRKSGLS